MLDIKKYSNGRFFDAIIGTDKSDSIKTDRFLNTETMKHWVSDLIDRRINQVLQIMNLPTREQIASLNVNINSINHKIDALEALHSKTIFEPSALNYTTSEEFSEIKLLEPSEIKSAKSKAAEKKIVKRRTRKKA